MAGDGRDTAAPEGAPASGAPSSGKMKVFISYSRRDVNFADELELALADKGFEPLVDRHDIDANEEWRRRLVDLILSCDTVVFVLTEASAGSSTCAWEVEEAARVGKRRLVVTPGPVPAGVSPPPQLSALNWIYFWRNPDIPGSSFMRGLLDLERALKVDLAWLREQTRLAEQASLWWDRVLRREPAEINISSMLLRGNVLREALDWAGRTPEGANVPSQVADFLDASVRAEAYLKAQAEAQLAERETALKAAEAAVKDRARAVGRLRWVTGAALLVVLGLVALAGTWLWTAARSSVEAGDSKAPLFAQASQDMVDRQEYARAAMMALAGDPLVQDQMFGGLLKPDGYAPLMAALVRAHADGQLLADVPMPNGPAAMVGLPDGKRFVGFDQQSIATTWEIGKEKPVETFLMPAQAIQVQLLPDGDHAVVEWWPQARVSVWSLSKHEEGQVFDLGRSDRLVDKSVPGDAGAWNFALSPDGKFVLTNGMDNKVRLWRVGEPKTPAKIVSEHTDASVPAIAFDPENPSSFAVGLSAYEGGSGKVDGRITVWRTDDLSRPQASMRVEQPFTAMIWSQGNLVLGMADGGLMRTPPADTSTGKAFLEPLFQNYMAYKNPDTGEGEPIGHLAISSNQNILMVQTSTVIRLLHVDGGGPIAEFGNGNFNHAAGMWNEGAGVIYATPDAMHLRVLGLGAISQTRNLEEKDKDGTTTFSPRRTAIGGGAMFSEDYGAKDGEPNIRTRRPGQPDERFMLKVNYDMVASEDGNALAVDTKDDRVSVHYGKDKSWTTPVAGESGAFVFAPPGEGGAVRIATSSKQGVKIWQAGVDKEIAGIVFPDGEQQPPNHMAVSPDGQRVLLARENLELWRLGGKKAEWGLDLQDIGPVLFLPDGSGVLDVEGTTIAARDMDGRLQRALTGHHANVRHLVLSPDGKLMLSADDDGAVLLWVVGQRNYVQRFDVATPFIDGIGFDPDGRHVLAVAGETLARFDIDPLLLMKPAERVKAACEWARGKGVEMLSPEDRAKYPVLESAKLMPCVARGILPPPPPPTPPPAPALGG